MKTYKYEELDELEQMDIHKRYFVKYQMSVEDKIAKYLKSVQEAYPWLKKCEFIYHFDTGGIWYPAMNTNRKWNEEDFSPYIASMYRPGEGVPLFLWKHTNTYLGKEKGPRCDSFQIELEGDYGPEWELKWHHWLNRRKTELLQLNTKTFDVIEEIYYAEMRAIKAPVNWNSYVYAKDIVGRPFIVEGEVLDTTTEEDRL